MAGIDKYTTLCLHCDGNDGSTSFVDSSFYRHSVSTSGSPQVDTAQKVFGTASALFNGSNYLSIADNEGVNFGDKPFTIDCRVRWNGSIGDSALFGQSDGAGSSPKFALYYGAISAGKLTLHVWDNGATNHNVEWTWSPSADVWYHVMIVRNGGDWYLFVDGVMTGDVQSHSFTMPSSSSDFRVGADGENWQYWSGWIDEFRVSNGIARQLRNFRPDQRAYSVSRYLNMASSAPSVTSCVSGSARGFSR